MMLKKQPRGPRERLLAPEPKGCFGRCLSYSIFTKFRKRRQYSTLILITSMGIAAGRFYAEVKRRLEHNDIGPVDVVYTWVNGSDPRQAKALHDMKMIYNEREHRAPCNETQNPDEDDCFEDDATPSRYQDNEELRYSMRSIETFAPWIRKVYLVTNGQIPYWLNLDHPKLEIVTHSQLFTNMSHLPSFSSPAIETHLHRIPGLSRRWIYLNDDVMFGQIVHPTDFYTPGRGQRVFLAWPVPNCAENCPSNWLGDGFCDIACNTTDCEFDGGDCLGTNVTQHSGDENWFGPNGRSGDKSSKYCSKGCPSSWVGDKYCDRSCNYMECGYVAEHSLIVENISEICLCGDKVFFTFNRMDSGDCGYNDVYNNVHGLNLTYESSAPASSEYLLTLYAETIFVESYPSIYLNFSNLIPPTHRVVDGAHTDKDIIRTSVILQIPHMMIFTFFKDLTPATVSVTLTISGNVKALATHQPLIDQSNNENSDGGLASFLSEIGENDSSEYAVQFFLVVGSNGHDTENNTSSNGNDENSGDNTTTAGDSNQESDGDDGNVNEEESNDLLEWRKRTIIVDNNNSNNNNNIDSQDSKKDNLPILDEDIISDGILDSNVNGNGNGNVKISTGRTTLDHYGDSLKFVNKLMNEEFGSSARRVPAHMPHFLDTEIIEDMQKLWHKEFDDTSSHQLRHPHDMQYAFAYFYFLQHQLVEYNWDEVWEIIDSNGDDIVDDNELRTLAMMLNGNHLEEYEYAKRRYEFMNCSSNANEWYDEIYNPKEEKDSNEEEADTSDKTNDAGESDGSEEQLDIFQLYRKKRFVEEERREHLEHGDNNNNKFKLSDRHHGNKKNKHNKASRGALNYLRGHHNGDLPYVQEAHARTLDPSYNSNSRNKNRNLENGGNVNENDNYNSGDRDIDENEDNNIGNNNDNKSGVVDGGDINSKVVNKDNNSNDKNDGDNLIGIDRDIRESVDINSKDDDTISNSNDKVEAEEKDGLVYFHSVNANDSGENVNVNTDNDNSIIVNNDYDSNNNNNSITNNKNDDDSVEYSWDSHFWDTSDSSNNFNMDDGNFGVPVIQFPFADDDRRQIRLTKEEIRNCGGIYDEIKKFFKKRKKNKSYTVETHEDVAFLMMGTNKTNVRRSLDDIRAESKKFICLNDNINHSNPHSIEVVKVVHDFYESLFPHPSAFELPPYKRNIYLHLDELYGAKWRSNVRKLVVIVTAALMVVICIFMLKMRSKSGGSSRKYGSGSRSSNTSSPTSSKVRFQPETHHHHQ